MFIDRSRERSTRFLEWRIRLFGVGAVLAVAGMATEQPWMVWLAIAVLAVGFLLRFAPERDEGEGEALGPEPDRDSGDGEAREPAPEPERGPEPVREGGEGERGG